VLWLTDKGVWMPDLSHTENMRRCADYRATLGRFGAPPGKEWAQDIITRYRAGAHQPAYVVRLAMDALGINEPVLHPPAKPVPRPDAKERQAGDVEVTF
jgi:hypothetical protein